MAVNYQGVHNFVQLTNMCRVYDEDQRAKTTFYRSTSASFGKERKQSAAPSRPKPYSAPAERFGNRFGGGQRSGGAQSMSRGPQPTAGVSHSVTKPPRPAASGGGSSAPSPSTLMHCLKCGRLGHFARECPDTEVTCFKCSGKGHISSNCPNGRKERASGSLSAQSGRPKTTGRVFALSGADAAKSDDLIQGICFIDQIPLVVLYDSGATHSFIARTCVEKLSLPVSSLKVDLLVDTPTSGSVLTSDVCLRCPVSISERQFLIDLIALPLSQIDVILGMDWLSSNHVLLNCFEKTVVIPESGTSESDEFLSAKRVMTFSREGAQMFMIVASQSVETKTPVNEMPVCQTLIPSGCYNFPKKKEREEKKKNNKKKIGKKKCFCSCEDFFSSKIIQQ